VRFGGGQRKSVFSLMKYFQFAEFSLELALLPFVSLTLQDFHAIIIFHLSHELTLVERIRMRNLFWWRRVVTLRPHDRK